MRLKTLALALAGVALSAVAAVAQTPIKPAVVYDKGGKFDKSFNEAAFIGAEKFKQETGTEFRDFEPNNDAQIEQALRRFARDGNSPIIAVGFSQATALQKVAAEFPDLKFTIIDMVVELPNVQSIVFKEHEGSYIVGLLAAMASKTGKVGFVGGMDIPLIRKFACGYVQGVKAAKPDAEIFQNMTGSTPQAWNDPVKGGELAKSQIDRGADVIYHAAGGTGIGVLRAAADAGKLGIGVDSNQNGLQPGKVLTSMLKRVDVAAYNSFKAARDGTWKPGVSVLGLKEDGIAWALDDNNKALITPEMKAAADKAKADIIAGTVKVHDYMSDSKCTM
ncbi:BMP family ABC transporter substrate-binding protein [Bosea caraganae]|uniref:BMP family ABC transporter substrate-binding protein n=1 Tax=Bosea caraganae TaxID=2763117 RepID=A0A370KYZ1_9HYPH|nr:BMP family ABC transporter substrate-binding protein [Bosea caraganae]RDJ20213.1 BMP family ABC transporter substrate-binding protein [Bosea caraganae]RDJ21175.1 BMP family ABC transporter substrate-binding protein [Bosea caraganae]